MALEDESVEAPEPEASLRDTLTEAFATDAAQDDAGEGLSPPAPVQAAAEAAKPAEGAQGAPARAPDGKFVKAPEQAQLSPEPKPQAGVEPGSAPIIAPPASWSPAAKADFSKLAPHIQSEVLKREKDIEAGKAQWDQKAEKLNALDSILAPRRDAYTIKGLTDVQRVQALIAAEELLDRDPVTGIVALARQFGVDLRRFGAGAQGQPAQPQPTMHPAIQQLANEVNTLKSALAQQQGQAQHAVQTQALSEVEAFRTDPKNLYFDNVRDDIVAMLQSGRAATLQEAYDRAVWSNPETRTLVAQAAEDQRRAGMEQAARAKASAARHASGSIIGSPSPGSSPAGAGPAASIRDELARAFSEAS